jgi:hypothetical protein
VTKKWLIIETYIYLNFLLQMTSLVVAPEVSHTYWNCVYLFTYTLCVCVCVCVHKRITYHRFSLPRKNYCLWICFQVADKRPMLIIIKEFGVIKYSLWTIIYFDLQMEYIIKNPRMSETTVWSFITSVRQRCSLNTIMNSIKSSL